MSKKVGIGSVLEALDNIAGVMDALKADPQWREQAETLDAAGPMIIRALVYEFSVKADVIDRLSAELADLQKAWGDDVALARLSAEASSSDGRDARQMQ